MFDSDLEYNIGQSLMTVPDSQPCRHDYLFNAAISFTTPEDLVQMKYIKIIMQSFRYFDSGKKNEKKMSENLEPHAATHRNVQKRL